MHEQLYIDFAFCQSIQRLYLVGSSTDKTTYNVLKIDRTEPYALKIHDDGIDYSHSELDQLLKMIHFGNKSYATRGVEQVQSSFGIVGMWKNTDVKCTANCMVCTIKSSYYH